MLVSLLCGLIDPVAITGKLLHQMTQFMGRISFWKNTLQRHKGVCDGIGGAAKARVAEHCRGKRRENVTEQNYEDCFAQR